jgi:DNA replication protein DnaC
MREAKKLGTKHLFGEHREKIIEMSMLAESGSFVCPQCKREGKYRFNPVFLAYDKTQKNCSDCDIKIAKALRDQTISEKLIALERFENGRVAFVDSMIKNAGVPIVFQKASFSDLEKATSKALSPHTSYFIKGNVGVGKSHMAVALMREHIKSISPEYDDHKKEYHIPYDVFIQPEFVEVPELLLRIRDTYNDSNEESEKDIVDHFTQTPFLVLDDLGTEKASEFSTLMIYLIINRRCTQGKTTIITSNLDLEQIRDRLSDRISSRIKGMCQEIVVSGNDKRYEIKRQQ